MDANPSLRIRVGGSVFVGGEDAPKGVGRIDFQRLHAALGDQIGVESAGAGADDGLAIQAVSQSQARRPLVVVHVLERPVGNAAAFRTGRHQHRMPGIGVQVKIGNRVVLLYRGRVQLIAQPDVQGEFGSNSPVVLREEIRPGRAQRKVRIVREALGVGRAQQKIRQWILGVLAVEVENSAARAENSGNSFAANTLARRISDCAVPWTRSRRPIAAGPGRRPRSERWSRPGWDNR